MKGSPSERRATPFACTAIPARAFGSCMCGQPRYSHVCQTQGLQHFGGTLTPANSLSRRERPLYYCLSLNGPHSQTMSVALVHADDRATGAYKKRPMLHLVHMGRRVYGGACDLPACQSTCLRLPFLPVRRLRSHRYASWGCNDAAARAQRGAAS